jgi:NTE family protein
MRPLVHRIDGAGFLETFPASSKADASWPFISRLHDFGRKAAERWLDSHYDLIGKQGTLDLRIAFAEGDKVKR